MPVLADTTGNTRQQIDIRIAALARPMPREELVTRLMSRIVSRRIREFAPPGVDARAAASA